MKKIWMRRNGIRKYIVAMRIVSLLIFLSSCTINSGGQNAYHLDNKGVTGDAVSLGEDRFVMCGETAKYADRSKGNTQKDGFGAFGKFGHESFETYGMGDGEHDFRWEKLGLAANHIILSGYGFKDKQAIISCYSKEMESFWSYISDSLKGIEEPSMITDPSGSILMAHRNPAVSPYDAYLTFIDPTGAIKWTRIVRLVDDMTELITLSNGSFLMHYLQKGAYIDAETRKKYFILPVLFFSAQGTITSQFHFHADRAKFSEISIHKVLSSDQGYLYFLGSVETIAKRKDLLILKSDLEGRILWSYTYKTDQHFDIKTAVADSKGGLVFVADAYGHSGGMMCAAVSPDGDIKWNNLIPSTPYEQVIDMVAGKENYEIFYDKILNFGILKTNNDGLSCLGPVSKMNITREDAEIVTISSNTLAEPGKSTWRKINIQVKKSGKIKALSDCKK